MRRLKLAVVPGCLIGGTLFVALSVKAGDGTLEVVEETDDDVATQVAIDHKVYLDTPRTDTELDGFEEQMRIANRVMCDATDGLLHYRDVKFVNHPAQKKQSDVWWYRTDSRSNSDRGSFGSGGSGKKCDGSGNVENGYSGRFVIYSSKEDDGIAPVQGYVIAHEFGHLLLGIGDEYTNLRQADRSYVHAGAISGPESLVDQYTGKTFFRSLTNLKDDVPAPFSVWPTGLWDAQPLTPSGDPLYQEGILNQNGSGTSEWWMANTSLMQQAIGQVCRSEALGWRSPADINPLLYGTRTCFTDADCTGQTAKVYLIPVGGGDPVEVAQDFDKCGLPATASELTIRENNNLSRFNLDRGDAVEWNDSRNRVQEAREVVIQGFLRPSSDAHPSAGTPWARPFCASGLVDGNPLNEFECNNRGTGATDCPMQGDPASPDAGFSNPATCDGCLIADPSACQPILGTMGPGAFCGDGNIDVDAGGNVGEQCDNGSGSGVDTNSPVIDPDTGDPLKCSDVYSAWRVENGEARADTIPTQPLVGGEVYCHANCMLDLSRCAVPFAEAPSESTLEAMEAASDLHYWAEVFDEDGEVADTPTFDDRLRANFGQIGPSNHILHAFLTRTHSYRPEGWPAGGAHASVDYRDVWTLTFAMDGLEFGGTWGDSQEVASFELEFAVDWASRRGELVSVDGNEFDAGDDSTYPEITISGLDRGTSDDIDLTINLANLETLLTWADDGLSDRRTDIANMYARHRTKVSNGVEIEVPQYGSVQYKLETDGCTDKCAELARFYELAAYNPLTQRYDTSRNTADQMYAAFYNWSTGDIDEGGLQDPEEVKENMRSGWEALQKTLCDRWGIEIDIPEKAEDVVAEAPDEGADWCPSPDFDRDDISAVNFDEDTQIVFVLDHSGSMGTEDTSKDWDGTLVSRLDYVKHAGLDFLRDVAAEVARDRATTAGSLGPKFGLVWYSDDAEIRFPGTTDTSCTEETAEDDCDDVTAFESGVCLNGKCKRSLPRVECFNGTATADCPNTGVTLEEITVEDLADKHMRLTTEAEAPEPPAEGWTATGAALQRAIDIFDPDSGTTKIVVLLSDGIHNRPEGGKCADGSDYRDEFDCWPAENATKAYDDALDEMEDKDILFYAVPLQVTAEYGAQAIRNGEVGGEVYEAQRNFAEDTIPLFKEAYSATRGQSLARSHLELGYIRGSSYHAPVEYDIPVEEGAQHLSVTVSDIDATRDEFLRHASIIALVSPSGERIFYHPYDPASAPWVHQESVHYEVDLPEPGTWRVVDDSWGGVEVDRRHSRFYVAAHVENPTPACYAGTNVRLGNGTEPVRIYAQAFYERQIDRGVNYQGFLFRSNFTMLELDFQRDLEGRYVAEVDPSEFTGDGLYTALVTCDVPDGAELARGEESEHVTQGYVTEPDVVTAPAFVRQAHAYFRISESGSVGIPGLGGTQQDQDILDERGLPPGFSPEFPFLDDADGDGILNDDEPDPSVDTDGDGRPDVFDSDSNGNEVPDGVDPTVPGSPAGGGNGGECGLANAATCCVSAGQCLGVWGQTGLFAEGTLQVRDRARVVNLGGQPAAVLNAGATFTDVGVEALVGSIRSKADVELRDRSHVGGSIVSAGDVVPHNDVQIDGSVSENSAASSISLSSFALNLPNGTEVRHLEPDTFADIVPGKYKDLIVKSRSTAFLTAGTYFVNNLELHPQAVLSLDMSAGPIYIYVKNRVMYHGSTVTVGGKFEDFFIGYFGTDSVTLETAFDGTFVAPSSTLYLATEHLPRQFRGGYFARDVWLRPDSTVQVRPFVYNWVSPEALAYVPDPSDDPPAEDPPTGFVCSGACLSATPLALYQHSGNLGTVERWFVVNGPVSGWQVSNLHGRTLSINGVTVTPGQLPLPAAAADGRYYFAFGSGGVAWTSWSYW